MSIQSLTKIAVPFVLAASTLTGASAFASFNSSSQTQNLIASAPQKQLLATVRSQGEPQRGQKARSSGNFSTDNMPQGYSYLCWEVSETSAIKPSEIKFNVTEDRRVLKDKSMFREVTHSTKTEIKKARNLYISNPSGAYDQFGNTVGFAVNVYACN